MFSRLFAAAAALTLFVPFLAQAESISRTLNGKRLAIAVPCVDTVEIQPEPDLAGKVTVEATSDVPGELRDFVFAGGETASVARERHACATILIQPKVTVSIHVPPGMAIDVKSSGSTNYVIGPVGGALSAHFAGSGNIKAESATDLDLSIGGSSDARFGRINGTTDIRIAGSGDVKIADGTMPSLKIDVRGSGEVRIDQGQIGTLEAKVAGSGNLKIKADVQDATLSTVGSGDIEVAKVTGVLSSSKVGAGTIRIGRAGPG